MNETPHVAQNTSGRRSAVDGRTTRHGGDDSPRIMGGIRLETIGGQEKADFRGHDRGVWGLTFATPKI